MSDLHETVRLTECPRCAELVLVVRVAGLTHLLARWSVPYAHATVLAHYGVTVLRLVRTGMSTYVTEFDPRNLSGPLATAHVCGIDLRPVKGITEE